MQPNLNACSEPKADMRVNVRYVASSTGTSPDAADRAGLIRVLAQDVR
jgi:hypothetical protein